MGEVKVKLLSHVRLSATPWTVACQAPLAMGFSRQEYWSGLPFPSPGDLPHPGIEPRSLAAPELAGGYFIASATWEASWRGHLIAFYTAGQQLKDSLLSFQL